MRKGAMPQLILPIIPEGATEINQLVSVYGNKDRWAYVDVTSAHGYWLLGKNNGMVVECVRGKDRPFALERRSFYNFKYLSSSFHSLKH